MPIPDDDPHFLTVGVSCISLKRDTPAALLGPATPREYSNVLTSFVDASLVYGSDRNTLDALRDTTNEEGLMKEIPHPSSSLLHGLLPTTTEGSAVVQTRHISHVFRQLIKEPT